MTDIDTFRRVNWSTLTATHAQQRPDADALRYLGTSQSWSELDDRVSRLASWLRANGVTPGDRVAVLTLNRPEFLESMIAIARVAAIAVPLNFRLSPPEVGYILGDSAPRVVIVEAPLLPLVAGSGYSDAAVLVVGDEVDPQGLTASSYEAAIASGQSERVIDDVDENSPAMILYTSGTTGQPKGAVLSHLNLFVQGLSNIRAFHLFAEDEVVMIATPLFHVAGIAGFLPVIITGGAAVVYPVGTFDASDVVETLETERVTSVFFVPAQWQAIVDEPTIGSRQLVLKATAWGAAPAAPALLERMAQTFPGAFNVATFGQTEMSPVTCVLLGEDAARKLGSVGRPVSYVQMRVVDPEMNDVPVGEVGEIVYRGPNTMLGYWNRPDATADSFRGGWFHSGDLVRQDEEGFVYVVDRLKDMIICGGENIYCAEVENALAAHPAVAEVAVVGRADERWGEVPIAIVVSAPEQTVPELAELRVWLGDRLASYKHPKDVVTVAELPRNASGKIQKFALRAEHGSPVTQN